MTGFVASRAMRRRGASVYVAVLGVGMVVSMVALTTSLTGRLQLRTNQRAGDQLRASLAARSGIEYALNWMNRNSDWRTVLSSGVDQQAVGTFGGRFVWRVTDADGDLADDARDHAVLRVVGYDDVRAQSTYVLEVDIEPAGRALTCLESAVHAGMDLELDDDATISSDGIVSSNNDALGANGIATYNADVEVVRRTDGGSYPQTQTEGVLAREMPGEHVFDWYIERGTEIPMSALEGVLFSSDERISIKRWSRELSNFGDPNPLGIYWIDCGGTDVRIRWSRSLGTLVLLNAGGGTEVEDVVLLQAEAQNYPVLMVQGNLRLDLRSIFTGQELHEGSGTNYNPAGIPYQGVTDGDDDDKYPARLDGIVYATGNISVNDEATIHGNLIAENVFVEKDETLTVSYRDYAYNYPPPGFSAGQGVRVLPGTYRRVSF